MATQVQFRGGTTTEHSSFNGVAREVTVDTTKKTLVVQDGSTNGGFPLLRQDLDNLPAGTIKTADIDDLQVTSGKIAVDAVTGAKIADDAVGAEHIEDLDADVKWLDTKKAVFGTDNDCKLHFNGTKTWVDIYNGDFGIAVSNASDHSADFIAGGGVKLYWDGGNNPKFETTSAGGTLTGHLTVTGEVIGSDDINIPVDNKKINLGASADLKLYHNGSNYIQYANGNLVIKNGTEADAACIQFDSNGDLYVPDDALIYLGGSADLKIKHDSVNGNSVIENITGSLGIQSDTLYLQDKTNAHAYITAVKDGAVGLRYDNSQKFATDADGVTVYDYGNNTVRVRMESAQGNAGSFYGYTAEGSIGILTTAGDWGVKCINNGASSLHHDGNGILQTSTNGILVNTATAGIADADNLTVADSANCGITIRSGDDDYGNIFFSDATSGGGTYAGYLQYNHGSNGLNFGTNETHHMTLDSSGRLGIGTSSPGSWHPNANQFVISRSGSCGLSIDSTSSTESSIYFGDGTDSTEAYMGFIEYSNQNDNMSIGVAGTTCIQILSSNKDVRVHNGNLVIGTAGKGIDFSNQTWTSATGSNTDSEVLDHYEEGTWTPTLLGISGTNPSGGTFAINRATFIRVGRLVSVSAYISWNADWSGAAGVVNFGGLPYAVSGATTNDTHYGGAAIGFTSVPANLLNANQTLSLYANSGTSNIYGYTRPVGTSASVGGTLGAATWFNSNAGYVCFTMTYRAHS